MDEAPSSYTNAKRARADHQAMWLSYAAVEANIKQTEHKAAELVRALATLTEGDPECIVARSFQAEIDQTNALHRAQVKRRALRSACNSARRLTEDTIGDILTNARDVKEGIDNATQSDKRRRLERLGAQILVKGSHFTINCLLGEWEREIPNALAFPCLSRRVREDSLLESSPSLLSAGNRENRSTWEP